MGLGLIASIIVGGIAGWIASMIMKTRTGILGNILLGIAGAVVLNFVLGLLNIYASDAWTTQLVVALVGACGLIWGWRKLKR